MMKPQPKSENPQPRVETDITGKGRHAAIAAKKKELLENADRVIINIDEMKYRKEKEFVELKD